MTVGFNGLENETVLDKTANSVSLTFNIPDTNKYFNGHFPGYPILPAVAQMEIVVRFAKKYLGTTISVSQIKRMKFNTIISPLVTVMLKLEKNDDTLIFRLTSPEGDITYSNGNLVMEKM